MCLSHPQKDNTYMWICGKVSQRHFGSGGIQQRDGRKVAGSAWECQFYPRGTFRQHRFDISEYSDIIEDSQHCWLIQCETQTLIKVRILLKDVWPWLRDFNLSFYVRKTPGNKLLCFRMNKMYFYFQSLYQRTDFMADQTLDGEVMIPA